MTKERPILLTFLIWYGIFTFPMVFTMKSNQIWIKIVSEKIGIDNVPLLINIHIILGLLTVFCCVGVLKWNKWAALGLLVVLGISTLLTILTITKYSLFGAVYLAAMAFMLKKEWIKFN